MHFKIIVNIRSLNSDYLKDYIYFFKAKESFADLWLLPTIEGVVLQQANKIYIRNNFTLNVEFASTTKDSFNSEIQNIDFEQKENAANEINTWVNI